MDNNPFKIIKPSEEVPAHLKDEVMDNIESIILLLRFIQLFVGDYSESIVNMLRAGNDPKDLDINHEN